MPRLRQRNGGMRGGGDEDSDPSNDDSSGGGGGEGSSSGSGGAILFHIFFFFLGVWSASVALYAVTHDVDLAMFSESIKPKTLDAGAGSSNIDNDNASVTIVDRSIILAGDRVRAKYLGEGGSYYAGVIAGVNSDGTFSVYFDDGDKDPAVKAEDIKMVRSRRREKKRSGGGEAAEAEQEVRVARDIEGSMTGDERREGEEFLRWANEELGIKHLLRLGYNHRRNPIDAAAENIRIRATFANRDIKEGEEVLSIPIDRGGMTFYPAGDEKSRQVFDALHKFLGQSEVKEALGGVGQEWVPWHAMVFALVYNVALGEASIFSKYINHSLLPVKKGHHLYTMESREEVEKAFPVKFGFDNLFDLNVEMRGLTATFRDVVNPFLLGKFPEIFGKSDLTFDKWIWAFGICQARQWLLTQSNVAPFSVIKEKYPEWSREDGETYLLPVADLMNHDQIDENAECGMELKSDGEFYFICRALKSIAEGTEVTHSYSELCRQESAHLYGFWDTNFPLCE